MDGRTGVYCGAMADQDVGVAATALGTTAAPSLRLTPAVAEPVTVIANRYEILGLVGVGGMGRVYRVHDRALDEIVALKLLRRELLETPGVVDRFRQEVKLARRVTHAHVVRTFDLGQHGADHFLTMEYVEGRSLAQLIDEGPLAIAETMRIATAVCAGIAAAHATGVLHRDLKPDNVLVARSGRIALTDFGIARVTAEPTTTADQLLGTPAYMAPEQIRRSATIGPPADVYAFGAMLFEMLTGRRPFPGADPLQVAIARLHEPPPDPRILRALPDAVAELVLRCMAREPADRYADGAALAAALAGVADCSTSTENPRRASDLPGKASRSVAILPLRASAELAELAEGLSEEIADALSMTRALRVRPLASVRRASVHDGDARQLGEALGVDVIVDGSIRRRADRVRIASRVIGVADGFQLWASHFDVGADQLLAACDDVVRAIASALTVEIALPSRSESVPRATELYLEAKARLRTSWLDGAFEPIIADLEQAHELAPDEPSILATLAIALARSAFYGAEGRLPRARRLRRAGRRDLHRPRARPGSRSGSHVCTRARSPRLRAD